jgi:hypothetical protein
MSPEGKEAVMLAAAAASLNNTTKWWMEKQMRNGNVCPPLYRVCVSVCARVRMHSSLFLISEF